MSHNNKYYTSGHEVDRPVVDTFPWPPYFRVPVFQTPNKIDCALIFKMRAHNQWVVYNQGCTSIIVICATIGGLTPSLEMLAWQKIESQLAEYPPRIPKVVLWHSNEDWSVGTNRDKTKGDGYASTILGMTCQQPWWRKLLRASILYAQRHMTWRFSWTREWTSQRDS